MVEEGNQVSTSVKLPGTLAGLLVGLLHTAALLSVLYAGWQLVGLPFAPYDMFDWMGRVLPGRLVTMGIDSMVTLIRALGVGPTSVVAKLAEHLLAVVNLLLAGTLIAGILFLALRLMRSRHSIPWGIAAGLVLGIPAVFVSFRFGRTATVPDALGVTWHLVAFVNWGLSLAWVYRRLATPAIVAETRRETPPDAATAEVQPINRRQFLVRLGAATAVITVSGAVIGQLVERQRRMAIAGKSAWSASHSLPNENATLQPAAGTRPELTPLEQHYRIDINSTPVSIDGSKWRLRIIGMVDRPAEFTLNQLRSYEPLHQFITLACISNPLGGDLISTTRWTGVSLQRLMPDLHPKPNATHLKITSADGFFEILPLNVVHTDERVMLCYDWDGLPLPADHGFPLRIYIPDHYGMKQPKWIESIEFMDHWEPGYWVIRGWDREAQMRATSVIDTVASNMMIIEAEKTGMLVPIGGIAHAGARGISKVEVRVDDGPWQQAQLRTPLSNTTWVIWRYDWPFQAGQHTWIVRCYDGQGAEQIEDMAPPHPSGTTGLHSHSQML